MEYSLESTAAERLIVLGNEKDCRQLVMAINRRGQTQFKGNLDKRLALKKLQESVLQEYWKTKRKG